MRLPKTKRKHSIYSVFVNVCLRCILVCRVRRRSHTRGATYTTICTRARFLRALQGSHWRWMLCANRERPRAMLEFAQHIKSQMLAARSTLIECHFLWPRFGFYVWVLCVCCGSLSLKSAWKINIYLYTRIHVLFCKTNHARLCSMMQVNILLYATWTRRAFVLHCRFIVVWFARWIGLEKNWRGYEWTTSELLVAIWNCVCCE